MPDKLNSLPREKKRAHAHTHMHHPNEWLKATQQMLLIWTLLKHLIKMSHEISLAKQVKIGWNRRIPMQMKIGSETINQR